ncbi:MAG: hypothetical protein V1734_06665, partial [Nanoarchaeota archaeon]
NVSMSQDETGIYSYNFTTSSSQTGGVWETVVSVTINGVTIKYGDYWELESSPAEVTIISITDTEIPDITASVRITNEGTIDYEYHYEYCIVSSQDNSCGGGDDLCYGLGAKLINITQSWTTSLTCSDSFTAGTNYYFKVVVHWGTERSGAARQFTATAATSVTPAPSGGGGGGGGGGAVTPKEEEEEEVEITPGISKYPIFKIRVPDDYRKVTAGGISMAEITAMNFNEKLKGVIIRMKFLALDDKLIVSEYESKDMAIDKPITKKLRIPEWIANGKYILRVEATYLDDTTMEEFEIEVVSPEEKPSEVVLYIKRTFRTFVIVILGSLLLLLLLLLIIYLIVKAMRRRRGYSGGGRVFRAKITRRPDDEESESAVKNVLIDMQHIEELRKDRLLTPEAYGKMKEKLLEKMGSIAKGSIRKTNKEQNTSSVKEEVINKGKDLEKIVDHMRKNVK